MQLIGQENVYQCGPKYSLLTNFSQRSIGSVSQWNYRTQCMKHIHGALDEVTYPNF